MSEWIKQYKWYIIAGMVILGLLFGSGEGVDMLGNPDK